MAPLNPTAAVCVNRLGHCGTGAQGAVTKAPRSASRRGAGDKPRPPTNQEDPMTDVAVPNERDPEIHEADPEQRADPCLLRGRLGLGSMPAFDGLANDLGRCNQAATEDIEREARCREGDV